MYTPDSTDLELLRLMASNGGQKPASLAAEVGVSEETARRRIKRLRDEGLLKQMDVPQWPCEVGVLWMIKVESGFRASVFGAMHELAVSSGWYRPINV